MCPVPLSRAADAFFEIYLGLEPKQLLRFPGFRDAQLDIRRQGFPEQDFGL
jgi:hypothetical protein